jgi:hypothetical protein
MTLKEKRIRFTRMVAELVTWAHDHGLEIAFAPEHNRHMNRSLHYEGLAKDFDLYVNGEYQTQTEAYEALGYHWESMGGAWGGRFRDGCHFSLAHGGRK